MSEELDRYQMVASRFEQVVQEVPADGWAGQSPCVGWTARDVVAHVVRNHRSMAAAATGVEPADLAEGEDPAAAWSDAFATMRRLVDEPAAMATLVNGPGGQIPLEQALGSVVSLDTHIHTWDLAQAIGRQEQLDPGMIRLTRAMLEPMGDLIRRPGIFGAEVAAPDGADEQTQLLCFLGRQV